MEDTQKDFINLAIIGAGIYGIQAARTHLTLHPSAKVQIFEAGNCIGGVWSSERMYDAFWTQTPLSILGFSDLELNDVPECDTHLGFFKAEHVSRYLERYVATRVFDGLPLGSRVRFGARVTLLTKYDTGWDLKAVDKDGQTMTCFARQVIDATGLTSNANLPSITGRELFRGTVIHHKDFGKHELAIFSDNGNQDIIVIGGAKSAADVAYTCAKNGKNITWVIRRNGAGPAAFVSAKGRGMYKNSNESFYTRLVSHFLASIFVTGSESWLEKILHRTRIGRWMLRKTWTKINQKAHDAAGYERADGVANGFKNLKPDTDIFWQNDSTGIQLHDDFFDTIAQHVRVYRADVKCFNDTGIELEDGTCIGAQVVIFATGWKTSHPRIQTMDGSDIAFDLGLSVQLADKDSETSTQWAEIDKAASTEITTRFPILKHPPNYFHHPPDGTSPLRLYQGILPIKDRSIVFLGQMMLGNHFRAAEVQALFAVAALDGTLSLPSEDKMRLAIARVVTWCRLRYLAKGRNGNWLYWDLVPYSDNLLQELGLRSHLHGNRWRNLISPCFVTDLKGIIEEHKQNNPHAYGESAESKSGS